MGPTARQPDALKSVRVYDPAPTPRRAPSRALAILLVLLLSLLVGVMAYQAPPAGRVAVGWLGDRLFLATTAGLGADAVARGDFFADDLTPGSPTNRSRWTRQHARMVLPNLGAGADLQLSLSVQGWPDDPVAAAVRQPTVQVRVDGTVIGSFIPTSAWATYVLALPATIRTGADLTVDLDLSHTFTDTVSFGPDPRPKGVRLAELRIQPAAETPPARLYPPAWRALLLLACSALLLYLLLSLLVRSTTVVYVATAVGVAVAAVGLAASRIWMGAALSVALLLLLLLLLLVQQQKLLALTRALVRRFAYGRASGYGLVTAALVLLGYALAELMSWLGGPESWFLWQSFPDALLFGLLGAGLLALIFVLGREGLPRLSDRIVALCASRQGSLLLLLTVGLIWIGYQAWVISRMPYVGHADYADNAVVARNLVHGRGWVVDYVTQFYELRASTLRPQETWPLLQPVWIAPFFLLFGVDDWVAKLPNLLFNAALLLLVYHIGSRIWDRRVGLLAALITLTNYLFFRLTIYVTSDLAFVLFNVGAIYCLYRWVEDTRQTQDGPWRYLLLAGLFTGLMMLQKPSGAMMALGMGLWFIAQRVPQGWQALLHALRPPRIWILLAPVAAWTLVALLLLSPYLLRNILLFGKPVYSTESHDAWVLGYRGDSGDAWEEI